MTDPGTLGLFVAGALSLGFEATKVAVGEGVKDAYQALKKKLSGYAANDVAELEKHPGSAGRKATIAEIVEDLPIVDKETLRQLALDLRQALKVEAPVGLDISSLDGQLVEIGDISASSGTGAHISDSRVTTLKVGNISAGSAEKKN